MIQTVSTRRTFQPAFTPSLSDRLPAGTIFWRFYQWRSHVSNNVLQNADPVTIVLWNSSDTTDTGPQTAWGGFVSELPLLGIGSPPWSTNGFSLMLQGPLGSEYEIDASTNLLSWLFLTNFTSTNSPVYFNDPSASNFNQRFYRATLLPIGSPFGVGSQVAYASANQYVATNLTLPAGGQLYVYAIGTGGGVQSPAFAEGQSVSITNGANFVTAELAVCTNNENSDASPAFYDSFEGLGVTNFNYAQGFYGYSAIGSNLSASVQFSLTASAMVVVVAVGGNQTYLTLSGLNGLTYDITPTNTVNYIPVTIAHTYLGSGTYSIQETTSTDSGQTPNNSADLIGVLIFSSSPSAASSTNSIIPIPASF
jgi:hypothetical protein